MSNYKNKNIDFSTKNIETQLIRGGTLRSNFGETSEAIFMNSGFCYNNAETAETRFNGEDPGYVYSRYLNPTLKMLEDRLSLIEGAEKCCVLASGMAAVFASIMCQIKAGDHLIASKVLFGSCNHIITKILPNYGVEISLIDGTNEEEWKKSFKKNTKMVFIESPANPNLELIDIKFVADLCKKNEAIFIVDNIFATPYTQKPLELGADIVVYSTTKHMDGSGKSLGGAVLGKEEFITETLLPFHRHTGPALSPFNAWLVLKSLETFTLRVEKQCKNALEIAKFLDSHPKIKKTIYPELKSHPQYDIFKKQMSKGGSLIAFEIEGGKKNAFHFMNQLKLIDISNNLGDSKSLITHPATTTHFNMGEEGRKEVGITDDLCRLSVGLENIDDLIADIKNALS
ncbi:MAG: O-succinylhomoserine sulfhydrylase [Candidatus Kariarchaeum pelagius]